MVKELSLAPAPNSPPETIGPVRGHGLHWNDKGGDGGLDLAAIVRILREHWKVIAASVVAGIALAVLATLLTKPLYRADVTLEVNAPRVEILDEEQRAQQQAGNSWDFLMTQIGLLESRSLAERVAQDLNLGSDPNFVAQTGDAATRLKIAAGKVAGGIDVTPPEDGQLIRYTFTSENPQVAAKVANGLADGFIESSLQRRFDASNHAREFLQKQIAKTRVDLEKSEKQLVQYAQAEGIINTGSGEAGSTTTDASSLQGASLVALNSALAEATARRIAAEGAYRQARLAGGSSEVQTATSGLRATRAALQAEFQDKRTLLKPDHPDMQALQSRIDEIDRQISAEQSRLAGGKATTLLADYRGALAAENALKSRVNQLRGSVLDLRGRSIQYNILQRDVDTNRSLYDALLARYKEVGVAGGVGNSPVSIVDRAEVPGGPFKPNLMFNLIAGLGLGLLVGIAAALAMEFLNDVIKTRDDVRNRLSQACLGVVPRRDGKGSVVQDLEDPGSNVAEAYSAILAALRFTTDHGAPRAMLVTSSAPAEGKSSSAFAMAQNYARRGERVLLIDADLRRPVFKAHSNRQGLTKLLTNDEPLRGHLLDTQYDNLWLLPCGPTPPNPADLLSTPRFAAILKEASDHFDRVIVDGPPLLGLADAPLLATAAKHVVMVVEAGRTRTKAARQAIDQIQAAGAHVLGVILTKSTEEASTYGYRLYRYNAVDDRRDDLIMISNQAEA
jgi:capsular exopolysaccharide synthesis family protein